MNLLKIICSMLKISKKHEIQSMIVFKSMNFKRFSSIRQAFHGLFLFYYSSRVRNQADTRRQRLQEAATVHQFIRDLEDEEAQIR